MIPESVGAVLALVVFVLPGLTFELVRYRMSPSVERSPFAEVAVVALTSTVLVISGAVVVAVADRFVDLRLADAGEWIKNGDAYWKANYAAVARTVSLVVLVAVFFAVPTARLWQRVSSRSAADSVLGRRSIIPHPALWALTSGVVDGETRDVQVVAGVATSNGLLYTGTLSRYDFRADGAAIDVLSLRSPVKVSRPDAAEDTIESPWSEVVIPLEQVTSLTLAYVRAETNAASETAP